MSNLPVLRSDWLRWKAQATPQRLGFEALAYITAEMAASITQVAYEMNHATYQLRRFGEELERMYASWPWYRRLWCRMREWRAGIVVICAGKRNWRSWP